MRRVAPVESTLQGWPDPWQMALIALCALILCSCRGPAEQMCPKDAGAAAARYGRTAAQPSLPAEAYTGAAAGAAIAAPMGPPGMAQGVPLPYEAYGPWAPPGIRQPWPEDEYLRDGGDEGLPTKVGRQGEVLGLEMEDAVAHYETLDGRTTVEPSNEVYIYSPRFGAVRQVVGLVANEEHKRVGGVHMPTKVSVPESRQIVADAKQNIQAGGEISARPAVALRTRQGDGVMSSVVGPRGFQNAFKPYENLAILRQGIFEEAEMPFLARGANAAIAWSHTQAVQIILDRQGAMADVKYDKSLSVYTVTAPPGRPRLQLVKVASTPFAQPGDEVDFTLRFDNIGNQTIGNVTIVDSLSTRLEYVKDSAQCSRDAKFSTEPNEGDSLVLRCEVTDPLEPGQGGLIRFRCRVR